MDGSFAINAIGVPGYNMGLTVTANQAYINGMVTIYAG